MAYFFDQLQKNYKTIRRSCWIFANSRLLGNHFVLVEVNKCQEHIQRHSKTWPPKRCNHAWKFSGKNRVCSVAVWLAGNFIWRQLRIIQRNFSSSKAFKWKHCLFGWVFTSETKVQIFLARKVPIWQTGRTIWSASADDRGKHVWFGSSVFRIRQNSQNKKNGQTSTNPSRNQRDLFRI